MTSQVGKGTKVTAVYVLSSIDRMPLGDMPGIIHTLITFNPEIDFVYTYTVDGRGFTLDTRQVREILEGIPLDTPEVSAYIEDFLKENTREADRDVRL